MVAVPSREAMIVAVGFPFSALRSVTAVFITETTPLRTTVKFSEVAFFAVKWST